MSSDEHVSSWHPALMPNSSASATADGHPSAPAHTQPPPAQDSLEASEPYAQDTTTSSTDSPAHPEATADLDASLINEPTEPTPTSEATMPSIPDTIPQDESANRPWFAEEPVAKDDAEEDWPVFDHPTSAPAEPDALPADAETAAPTEASPPAPEVQAAGPVLGHSSTVSFARTVSHDINFHDDEEADWNLSRTDTDPFKFMPPSDRTNSFPVVPPASPPGASTETRPLPATEAQHVIQATEQHQDGFDAPLSERAISPAQPHFADDPSEPPHINGFSEQAQYVGRDMTGADEDNVGSRFEEGLPLIPRAPEHTDTAASASFFDNEASADDDFFSNVQDAGHDDTPPTLERKSTMQVLGAFGTNPLSRADTLEEMAEEDEHQATPSQALATEDDASKPATEDLAAKWQEAFAGDDDDEFLLDDNTGDSKPVDPAAFFGSDDEGFLDDDDDETTAPAPAVQPPSLPAAQQQSLQGRYTPQSPSFPFPKAAATQSPYVPVAAAPPQTPTSAYAPSPVVTSFPAPTSYAAQSQPSPSQAAYGMPPPPRPEASKAQSFADKNKGGYTSPYDLPMDVKPRKRASMQQLPRAQVQGPSAQLPPRSSSMYAPSPTSSAPPSAGLPPPSPASALPSPGTAGPAAGPKPRAVTPSKENFFEDLPMTSRPRPASRQSSRLPSPALGGPASLPQGPPPGPAPGPPPAQYAPLPPSQSMELPKQEAPPAPPRAESSGLTGLVAPPRVSPYAALQSTSPGTSSIPNNSRYSPAPPLAPAVNGTARPGSANRYSPAPPASRPPSATYSAAPPPAAVLPHLPRTSSPLAHFEVSHDRAQSAPVTNGEHGQHGQLGQLGQQDRRISAQFEPRVNRVSSLPPTQEVEEDEGARVEQSPQPIDAYTSLGATPASPPLARHTPPPSAHGYGPSMLSPPKRAAANYTPQPQSNPLSPEQRFAPPMRSQTQSPGSLQNRYQPSEAAARPASSHGAAPPQAAQPASAQHSYAAAPRTGRHRAPSQSLNMVAPTDGRENDPLKRWKGAPVFSWGIGGTIITSFPKEIPRYGMGQTAPMIVRTPGEVRVKQVKDIEPLEDRLAKFPGPLKGKSKKKETISWLTAGIESLEANLPGQTYSSQITHEDKRMTERVLLWKILRTFIEFDGALEGGAEVEAAVRNILSPEAKKDEAAEAAPLYADGAAGVAFPATSTQMQADGVDPQTVVSIRKHLLAGDREQAVWAAVDKRLWGHAMLISNTVSPDLYKQVAQEFVRKEVNHPGHNNESIAALYKVLSGNFDECVDELVPSHARAGRQLMTTAATAEPAKDALDGLDKWRETLGLVLSNRSPDDTRALSALGDLLSTYGRAEAAHICFLFARKTIVFGGLDDQTASFVLLGADHKTQAEQFGKETEALLLSEVFEYGLSLANGANSAGVPHLAAYKLQHAATLAEHGFRDKALQYCDVIANSITAQTKRSPYHHPLLEAAVDDLSKRLKQAPKGESSSWISKPSMNKVSDSMWNRFNKFVAGDEADGSGTATPGEPGAETGPFGRIAGGTPTISPSPSVSNFDVYGNNNPGYPVTAPVALAQGTRAASRYAPMGAQPSPPATSYEPTSGYTPAAQSTQPSNDYGRASFDAPTRTSIDSQSGVAAGSYTPQAYNPAPYGAPQDVHTPQPDPAPSAYGPYGGLREAPVITHQGSSAPPADEPTQFTPEQDQGYQPPSYGYEPPSFGTNAGPESQQAEPEDAAASGGYEAPSYQPYSYEPPTYDPGVEPSNDDNDDDDKPKPKKKSFMDDDEDDIPALRPQGKSKSEKDKENDEMFRKAAEEDAKRAAEQSAGKKGWGFGSWWGGKKDAMPDSNQGNKPIRAKLGESSSFVYDPDQKRWVNKKAGAEQTPAKTATPPPPKSTGTPPPPSSSAPPMGPPGGPPRPPMPIGAGSLSKAPSRESLDIPAGPPAMARSVSNSSTGPPSGPPSRPTTSMSNASSIDDLIGAAGPRRPGAKKARKSGRYVDIMAK
ncbi:hypothetical protein VDGD_08402 [Verticillium dahliae]|nr:hypothetical protein VDGD_08402 [Verticillium dahliae]